MRRPQRLLGMLTLALALACGATASACPNCKEAVAEQPGEDATRLRDGYFYSILFMIGMPFLLFGTGVVMVVRAVRRGALPEL